MKLQHKILSVIAISAIASTALLADSTISERSTRLDSMSLNNYMTKDGFNIFFNPANVASHKTGAFLELGLVDNGGADADQKAGANVDGFAGAFINTGIGNFGVVLNRSNNNEEYFNPGENTRQNNIDLFYGIALANDFNLGMRMTYATLETSDSTSNNDLRVLDTNLTYNQNFSESGSTSNDESASDLTLQVGAQFFGFDATAAYGVYDYNENTTGSRVLLNGRTTTFAGLALDDNVSNTTTVNDTINLDADGASMVELALAYTFELSKDSAITGYGVYNATDYSVSGASTYNDNSTDYNSSTTGQKLNSNVDSYNQSTVNSHTLDTMVLGASYNLKPTENILVVVAGEYTNQKRELGYTRTTTQNNSIFTDFTVTPNTTHTTNNGATGPQNTAPDRDRTITTNDISVVIAAEAYVLDSLALRFGLRESVLYNYEDSQSNATNDEIYNHQDAVITPPNTSTTTTNTVVDSTNTVDASDNFQPAMQIAIGFGYRATESITLDGLVNANLFLTGPNFISGKQLQDVNARLALNYNF